MTQKPIPLEQRFWAKVNFDFDPDACWLWTGALKDNGYGQMGNRGQPNVLAHRLSWQFEYGPIPEGFCVCHKCDVRRCVRPEHLFLGTVRDNIHDMLKKGRHVPHPRLLTDEMVREIKDRIRARESHASISRDFAVSSSSIGAIARGRTYRD